MITPLDRETRKALVRFAEQHSEFRQAAHIILALSAGRDETQIANTHRTSLEEVRRWAAKYNEKGLAVFGREFLDMLGETSTVANEAPKQEETPPPPYRPRTPMRSRRPARPRRSRQTPSSTYEKIPPPSESEPDTIEAAIMEGLEFLADEVEDLDSALPPRIVYAEISAEKATPVEETKPAQPDITVPLSIGALAVAYDVDMAHARHISDLARTLFDATANIHRLPSHYRDLLHAAAMLHNIAFNLDPANHHTRGRDLILQYTLKDISDEERQIVAVMTALHRLNISPRHEPAYQTLPENLRPVTETLTALLRIGIGLDYSHTQSSAIVEWRDAPGELVVVLSGRALATDIPRALQKSNLWNRLYSLAQMRFVSETEVATQATLTQAPPRWPDLEPLALSTDVSNILRSHYVDRLDYLAERIRRGDLGLLVPLWKEFQRLIGLWEWLLPGSKPRQVFKEDSDWLSDLIQTALYGATVEDRSNGLLNETDPDHDDPQAIEDLKGLCDFYHQESLAAFHALQEALSSRRYVRWLQGVKIVLKNEPNEPIFASQIAERAWAYLSELRHVMDRIKRSDWNTNLEESLTVEVVESFATDLRLLTDLLIYSGSLLGTEARQVLDVLEPLLDYVQTWQRMEQIALAAQSQQLSNDLSPLVLQAFAILMRERVNEMRWNLVEMWEPLDTLTFRRALALAVAKP